MARSCLLHTHHVIPWNRVVHARASPMEPVEIPCLRRRDLGRSYSPGQRQDIEFETLHDERNDTNGGESIDRTCVNPADT